MRPPAGGERSTPLWLSHHDPPGYDRCVLIGGRRVCRRCLVLYPVTFAVLLVARAAGGWSGLSEALALVLLPLPAVVEFVLEHLRLTGYQPARQVAVTVPLAVGLAAGFDRYLDRHTDPLFWATVVVYGGVCLGAAVAGAGGARPSGDPEG
jgi:hypothetical protein